MNRKDYNSYQASYHIKRYHRIRNEVLDLLGGKCAICGSKDNLELDHINPEEKKFDCGKLLSVSMAKWDEEVKKLQILCKECHSVKSVKEAGYELVKGKDIHGTLSSYRYCKCELCKEAKSKYMKEYKKNKR